MTVPNGGLAGSEWSFGGCGWWWVVLLQATHNEWLTSPRWVGVTTFYTYAALKMMPDKRAVLRPNCSCWWLSYLAGKTFLQGHQHISQFDTLCLCLLKNLFNKFKSNTLQNTEIWLTKRNPKQNVCFFCFVFFRERYSFFPLILFNKPTLNNSSLNEWSVCDDWQKIESENNIFLCFGSEYYKTWILLRFSTMKSTFYTADLNTRYNNWIIGSVG